eukprot:m.30156 g.30156  ORF g.30156 m.30156 type:complete len:1409 (+) comp9221_c0_seq2:59-4285(+)
MAEQVGRSAMVIPDLSSTAIGKRASCPDPDDLLYEEPLQNFCVVSALEEFNARVSELSSSDNLGPFLLWVFMKRYGKAATNAAASPGDSLDASGREHFVASKAERVITMISEYPFCADLFEAHIFVLSQACDHPLVRKTACSLALEYFVKCPAPQRVDCFARLKELVCVGCSDVWSAVRSACVARLPTILSSMPLSQLADLYSELFSMCASPASTWQAVDGALQGITSILRLFSWTCAAQSPPNVDGPVFLESPATDSPHASSRTSTSAEQTPSLAASSATLTLNDSLGRLGVGSPATTSTPHRFSPSGLTSSSGSGTTLAPPAAPLSPTTPVPGPGPARLLATPQPEELEYVLQLNDMRFPQLPSFITTGFRPAMYARLAHPQLSIRENVTKALSAFLSRSQLKDVLECLREIVCRLRGDPLSSLTDGPAITTAAAFSSIHPEKTNSNSSQVVHNSVASGEEADSVAPLSAGHGDAAVQMVEAYEAEGLLGVLEFIIKHLKPGFLLTEWPLYHFTLERYLAHPASTVRQATSAVFKYIVARDSSSAIMAKLVLQGLSANCVLDRAALLGSLAADPPHRRGSVMDPVPKLDLPDTWEWREGRLLAYDLVLRFIVANHLHCLFPSSLLRTRAKKQSDTTEPQRRMTSYAPFFCTSRTPSPSVMPLRRAAPAHHSSTSQGSSHGSTRTPGQTPSPGPAAISRARSFERKRQPGGSSPGTAVKSPLTSLFLPSNLQKTPSLTSVAQPSEHFERHRSSPEYSSPVEPPPRPVLRRQLSTRSSSLHQHISHLDTTQPHEPFRPARMPRLSEAPLAMVGRSLISHVQVCDLYSFNTARLEIISEIDCTIRLPLARTSGHDTPTNELLSPSHHTTHGASPASQGWWREASSHNLTSPTLAAWGFGRTHSRPGPPASLPAWANTSLLEPFSRVLVHMLLQTAESMHCPQFELRRISSMVLPVLSEAMRWYDPELLERIWASVFPAPPTWLTYICFLTFSQSLSHIAWLDSLMKNDDLNVDIPAEAVSSCDALFEMIRRALPLAVPAAAAALREPVLSRISVAALDVLYGTIVTFRELLPASEIAELERHFSSVLGRVFLLAHPTAAGATIVECALQPADMTCLNEGPLSFSRGIPGERVVNTALSAVFEAMCSNLNDFVDACDTTLALGLCPMFLFYSVEKMEENVSQVFAEALHRTLDRAGDEYWQAQQADGATFVALDKWLAGVLDAVCALVLQRFLVAVSDKTIEAALLRQLLEVFVTMCVVVGDGRAFLPTLRAIAARVSAPPPPPPPPIVIEVFPPTSSAMDEPLQQESSEDEEESLVKSLNLSNGHAGRGLDASTNSWDEDWDDDFQSDEATLKIFGHALRQLHASCTAADYQARQTLLARHGRRPLALSAAVGQLGDADAKKIEWLMDQ